MKKQLCSLLLLFFACLQQTAAEDGYRLWLRYDKISDKNLLAAYTTQVGNIFAEGKSPVIYSAKDELIQWAFRFVGKKDLYRFITAGSQHCYRNTRLLSRYRFFKITELSKLNSEGFTILTKNIQGKNCIVIAGNTDAGVCMVLFIFCSCCKHNIPSIIFPFPVHQRSRCGY
jgi:alpha-glucuronidase